MDQVGNNVEEQLKRGGTVKTSLPPVSQHRSCDIRVEKNYNHCWRVDALQKQFNWMQFRKACKEQNPKWLCATIIIIGPTRVHKNIIKFTYYCMQGTLHWYLRCTNVYANIYTNVYLMCLFLLLCANLIKHRVLKHQLLKHQVLSVRDLNWNWKFLMRFQGMKSREKLRRTCIFVCNHPVRIMQQKWCTKNDAQNKLYATVLDFWIHCRIPWIVWYYELYATMN